MTATAADGAGGPQEAPDITFFPPKAIACFLTAVKKNTPRGARWKHNVISSCRLFLALHFFPYKAQETQQPGVLVQCLLPSPWVKVSIQGHSHPLLQAPQESAPTLCRLSEIENLAPARRGLCRTPPW